MVVVVAGTTGAVAGLRVDAVAAACFFARASGVESCWMSAVIKWPGTPRSCR